MADERQILELRIHGVNNTKPAAMLGLDANDVEMVAGDKLGSFWRPTAAGRAKGDIEDRVEREAYSWGEMARRSIGGDSGWSKAVGVASRAGWALLLPFGLVNVAYWTRKVDDGPGAEAAKPDVGWWRRLVHWNGWGAATLRVAGLLITLLLAVSTSAIVLDLVAVQCFVGQTKVCTVLPSALNFLTTMGQARRLALLSAVPIVLVLGLLGLSAATRVRYEQPDPAGKKPVVTAQNLPSSRAPRDGKAALSTPEPEASTAKYGWPLLAVRGFWSHRSTTKVTARLHMASVAATTSVATAVHVLFGYSTSCSAPAGEANQRVTAADFLTVCLPGAEQSPRADWEMGVIAAGIAVLTLVILSLVARSDYAVDVRASERHDDDAPRKTFWSDTLPMILSAIVFLTQVGVLVSIDSAHEPTARYLIGTSAFPAIILTVLIAIAVTALLWRLASLRFSHLAPNLIALSFVCLVLWVTSASTTTWRIAPTVVIVVLVVIVLVLRSRLATQHDPKIVPSDSMTAWKGSAPGVFLLAAMFLAMLLSSGVVSAAGNWLNSSNTAASLADGVGPRSVEPGQAHANLEVALPYMWFGAVALPVVLLMLVVVAAIAATQSLTWSGIQEATVGTIKSSVRTKRRFAALAHRAERYVWWLVVAATIGSFASLLVSAWGIHPAYAATTECPTCAKAEQIALDTGMVLLAGAGLLFLVMAVGGGVAGGVRPLGLAWDLMCFLPRSGHPLAPPCYAERAVPELAERCADWLSSKHPGDRRVVLSAHSLGSVLAIGVILSPRIPNKDKERISLLTYGSQLRPYFSRIFPELLGPNVLGIQECASSNLGTKDPWASELHTHPRRLIVTDTGGLVRVDLTESGQQTETPQPSHLGSVRVILSVGSAPPRWRNLWRRTDYLGFPMLSYFPNAIDKRTEEVVRVHYLAEVHTHSDYPKTDAYKAALKELIPAPTLRSQPLHRRDFGPRFSRTLTLIRIGLPSKPKVSRSLRSRKRR